MAPHSFPVSWEDLHRDARALAWRLATMPKFDRVVAIARGGLAPAAIIARELEIRYVDTVCIASYEDRDQGKLNVLKGMNDPGNGAGILVIDDLVDSGETARAVKQMLPNAHIATVYAKPAGLEVVDTYVTQVSQDTWIIFPWDEGEPVVHAHAAGHTAP